MRLRLLAMLILVILALADSAIAQDSDCGLATRFSAGQTGRVLPGPANNVRADPRPDATQVGRLPGGQYFTALEGSACARGYTWREIQYGTADNLQHGWTVESAGSEYYLEPSPYAGTPITYQGVSLVVPDGLADGAAGSLTAANTNADTGQIFVPAYVELALTGGYPDTNYDEYDSPGIEIYRADAFDAMSGPEDMVGMFEGAFVDTVQSLTAMLETRPDLSTYNSTGSRLPDLAPNASHGALAHLDYFDFQSGSGYRFITFYEQAFWYPENSTLLYRYDGLTADGRYLVVATLPVDAPRLPDPYDQSAGANDSDYGFARYQQYVDGVNAFFNAIPPAEWTPNLDWLDALIASLVIDEVPALESN